MTPINKVRTELKPWVEQNFGIRPSWHPLVGMVEEVGELSHHYLKRAQKIRLNEDHDVGIRDAIADLLVYLCDFCNAEGIDPEKELLIAWKKVRQRDWHKNPATGVKAPAETASDEAVSRSVSEPAE